MLAPVSIWEKPVCLPRATWKQGIHPFPQTRDRKRRAEQKKRKEGKYESGRKNKGMYKWCMFVSREYFPDPILLPWSDFDSNLQLQAKFCLWLMNESPGRKAILWSCSSLWSYNRGLDSIRQHREVCLEKLVCWAECAHNSPVPHPSIWYRETSTKDTKSKNTVWVLPTKGHKLSDERLKSRQLPWDVRKKILPLPLLLPLLFLSSLQLSFLPAPRVTTAYTMGLILLGGYTCFPRPAFLGYFLQHREHRQAQCLQQVLQVQS